LKTKKRFQIKSRWEQGNPSRQSRELNVIRNYEDNQLDNLIALIFDKRFHVREAYSIPHEVIRKYARYSKHQNGYILIAMGQVLYDYKAEGITYRFR